MELREYLAGERDLGEGELPLPDDVGLVVVQVHVHRLSADDHARVAQVLRHAQGIDPQPRLLRPGSPRRRQHRRWAQDASS